MIYEFYNRYSSGPILNYFNESGMVGTKLVSFKSLESGGDLRGLEDVETNRFTFGYEGNIFHLYIKKNDIIFLFTKETPPAWGKHNLKFNSDIITNKEKTSKDLSDYLIQKCRDYKLNSIL